MSGMGGVEQPVHECPMCGKLFRDQPKFVQHVDMCVGVAFAKDAPKKAAVSLTGEQVRDKMHKLSDQLFGMLETLEGCSDDVRISVQTQQSVRFFGQTLRNAFEGLNNQYKRLGLELFQEYDSDDDSSSSDSSSDSSSSDSDDAHHERKVSDEQQQQRKNKKKKKRKDKGRGRARNKRHKNAASVSSSASAVSAASSSSSSSLSAAQRAADKAAAVVAAGKDQHRQKNQLKKDVIDLSSGDYTSAGAGGSGGRVEREKEEERLFKEYLQREGTCALCGDYKGPENVLIMQSCDHRACPECLKAWLVGLLSRRVDPSDPESAVRPLLATDLQCPCSAACEHMVPDWMMNRVLTKDEYEALSTARLSGFLENSDAFIRCPNAKCAAVFERVAGSVNRQARSEIGPDGKVLAKKYIEHRAANRFRCQTCATVFCAACNTEPYHLGFTCEEFEEYKHAKHCRFCEKQITPKNKARMPANAARGIEWVCNDKECLAKRKLSCDKILPCGHPCCGVRGENNCLPCLVADCDAHAAANLSADDSDFCNICWVEPLGAAPTVRLKCGHLFHFACVKSKINKKWPGARITFGFLNCPLCKEMIDHPLLKSILRPYQRLLQVVKGKAVRRLEFEGLSKDPKITSKTSKYYNQPAAYAMDRFAYYPCHKCRLPYFGGRRACEDAARDDDAKYNPSDLVCGSCVAGSDKSKCKVHGKDYIDWKCKWCCSVATFFCWGNTHFCDSCHKRQEQGDYLTRKKRSELPKCPGVGKCPLGVKHPPNGEEFALGCAICRQRQNF